MGKPTNDDYISIRRLAERYVDAVNRFDGEAWGQTWAVDGVWAVGQTYTGREAMVAAWTGIMSSIPNVYMHVYSGVIDDVTGDKATGRWYMGEFLNLPGGVPLTHLVDLLLQRLLLPAQRMQELFGETDLRRRAEGALAEHARRGLPPPAG